MDTWLLILLSLTLILLTTVLLRRPRRRDNNLPPGPSPLSSTLILLTNSLANLEPILKCLKLKHGPLVTLFIGSRPSIFVGNHSLAHHILIQNGAVFSDRPKTFAVRNISSAPYGPTWRLLRRNLASEVLHPARVKSYSWAREWVLHILINRLRHANGEINGSGNGEVNGSRNGEVNGNGKVNGSGNGEVNGSGKRKVNGEVNGNEKINGSGNGEVNGSGNGEVNGNGVKVMEHFQYAMFCLLVVMCFGKKVDEDQINEIASVQRRLLLLVGSGRFNVLGIFPRLGKLLFFYRWKELLEMRGDQERTLMPLIKSRIESVKSGSGNEGVVAYVDTLVNLELPEEDGGKGGGGKLTEKEMVSMCGEFLNAGTDTTSTALQWIMANLVKFPHVQRKLYEEIVTVVGPPPSPRKDVEVESESVIYINEGDLEKMVYLKAVVLEALRRHPPGHFVLPHRVMKDVEVNGYTIPYGATINFMVGEMGLDPGVWDEPMEFKPERFLVNDGAFDITGSKGIKMMPFGAGRRICPGSDLALLHLEYFVANLVWYFDWGVVDGCDVDLAEKPEFTVVMKNPLRAKISSRV